VARKRITREHIVAKLREMERLQAQGMTIPEAARKGLGLRSDLHRWRLRFGRLQ
jgi:putative transposase